MSSQALTLVLGATGKTGGRVARALAACAMPVRTAARTGTDVHFDWSDADTYAAAVAGAQRIYLVGPLMRSDILGDVATFLDAAEKANVEHVTYLSIYGTETTPANPGVRDVELDLISRRDHLSYSVVRPAWFMQNFSEFFLKPTNGAIVVPTGTGVEAFIDADDIAAVSAATLLDPDRHNRAEYAITGPEALSVADAASIISGAAGINITHLDIAPDEWIAGAVAMGVPTEYGEVIRRLAATVASGNGARPNNVVEEVTGRKPRRFAEFARRESAAWTVSEVTV